MAEMQRAENERIFLNVFEIVYKVLNVLTCLHDSCNMQGKDYIAFIAFIRMSLIFSFAIG